MRNSIIAIALLLTVVLLTGCPTPVQSLSGTKMVTSGAVKTNADGKTIEQQNISSRIDQDNNLGSIKHLYVISAYSGQVIIYSTVKGKVTSSGKRLTPSKVVGSSSLFEFNIGTQTFYTDEILGEDGAYGQSMEYLYWWDSKGAYHQHYRSGGEILHISDQPLAVKNIIINMELTGQEQSAQ